MRDLFTAVRCAREDCTERYPHHRVESTMTMTAETAKALAGVLNWLSRANLDAAMERLMSTDDTSSTPAPADTDTEREIPTSPMTADELKLNAVRVVNEGLRQEIKGLRIELEDAATTADALRDERDGALAELETLSRSNDGFRARERQLRLDRANLTTQLDRTREALKTARSLAGSLDRLAVSALDQK